MDELKVDVLLQSLRVYQTYCHDMQEKYIDRVTESEWEKGFRGRRIKLWYGRRLTAKELHIALTNAFFV